MKCVGGRSRDHAGPARWQAVLHEKRSAAVSLALLVETDVCGFLKIC